jgi:hypothetical protein
MLPKFRYGDGSFDRCLKSPFALEERRKIPELSFGAQDSRLLPRHHWCILGDTNITTGGQTQTALEFPGTYEMKIGTLRFGRNPLAYLFDLIVLDRELFTPAGLWLTESWR